MQCGGHCRCRCRGRQRRRRQQWGHRRLSAGGKGK